jgi:hypothetical protein
MSVLAKSSQDSGGSQLVWVAGGLLLVVLLALFVVWAGRRTGEGRRARGRPRGGTRLTPQAPIRLPRSRLREPSPASGLTLMMLGGAATAAGVLMPWLSLSVRRADLTFSGLAATTVVGPVCLGLGVLLLVTGLSTGSTRHRALRTLLLTMAFGAGIAVTLMAGTMLIGFSDDRLGSILDAAAGKLAGETGVRVATARGELLVLMTSGRLDLSPSFGLYVVAVGGALGAVGAGMNLVNHLRTSLRMGPATPFVTLRRPPGPAPARRPEPALAAPEGAAFSFAAASGASRPRQGALPTATLDIPPAGDRTRVPAGADPAAVLAPFRKEPAFVPLPCPPPPVPVEASASDEPPASASAPAPALEAWSAGPARTGGGRVRRTLRSG